MERGTEVTVRAFKGEMLRRRVWEDVGRGVMLTSESEYQRAIREGNEAQAAGFAKSDVVEVHTPARTSETDER